MGVSHVTKKDVAYEVKKIVTTDGSDGSDNYTWEDTILPRLAFDNEVRSNTHCYACDNLSVTEFKYNLADAAGFNEVVFEWDLELERVYVTGHYCTECGEIEINVHDNDDEGGETIIP